jgi:archaellum biogenesis protein FlaJ (TadC family)
VLKPTPIQLNPEALRRQKLRNWAVFSVLLAFVILVFVISIVKMKGGH